MTDLYRRIQFLCFVREMTIAQLNKECGFPVGTIEQWQSQYPTADCLRTIAVYFNVRMEFLMHSMPDFKRNLHELKTEPKPFEAVAMGIKLFEYRFNDRGFKVGDLVCLKEYDPSTDLYSGRQLMYYITYLIEGCYGIPDGYCVFGIAKVKCD